MNPKDYSNYGLAQELRRLRTRAPELMVEAANRLAALSQTMQPQAGAASAKSVSDMLLEAGAIWGGIRGKWSATPAQINAFVEILNRATSQAEPAAGEQAGAVADERAAFESWGGRDYARHRDHPQEYASPWVQQDWRVWQARAALAAPGAAIAARTPVQLYELAKKHGAYTTAENLGATITFRLHELVTFADALASREEAPATPQAAADIDEALEAILVLVVEDGEALRDDALRLPGGFDAWKATRQKLVATIRAYGPPK